LYYVDFATVVLVLGILDGFVRFEGLGAIFESNRAPFESL
jgi:hypothetical protein